MTKTFKMCAVDSSLGDATTSLEHGDEAWLLIWHLMLDLSHIWLLPLSTFHVNC